MEHRVVACVSLLALLSACGGGGHGSPGPAGPPETTGATGSGGQTGQTESTTNTPAVYALQEGGTLSVSADGSTATIDSPMFAAKEQAQSDPAGRPPPFQGGQTFIDPSQAKTILEDMAKASGLSVADYGAWASYADSSSQTLSSVTPFAGGKTVTPAASIPTTGQASYQGGYVGYVSSSGIAPIQGNVQLDADFANQKVSTQFTSGYMSTLGLAQGQGSITPGTSSFQSQAKTSSANGPTYSLTGLFYGPSAPDEVAGIFSGSNGPATMAGSFGMTAVPIPTTGTASYAGPTTGTMLGGVPGGPTSRPLSGQANLTVNFGTQLVAGSVSNLQSNGTPLSQIDNWLPTTINYGAVTSQSQIYSQVTGGQFKAFVVPDPAHGGIGAAEDATDSMTGTVNANTAVGSWGAVVNRDPVYVIGDPSTPPSLRSNPNCSCNHPTYNLSGNFVATKH